MSPGSLRMRDRCAPCALHLNRILGLASRESPGMGALGGGKGEHTRQDRRRVAIWWARQDWTSGVSESHHISTFGRCVGSSGLDPQMVKQDTVLVHTKISKYFGPWQHHNIRYSMFSLIAREKMSGLRNTMPAEIIAYMIY